MLDSGNLTRMPERIGVVVACFKEMGYHAVGTGEFDLRAGKDALFAEADKKGLRILDAGPDASEPSVPYLVKKIGGVRVGVVSFGAVLPEENTNEYALRKSYYTAFKTVRGLCDVLVVLDQANLVTPDWVQRNSVRLGAPDVVITGMRGYGRKEPEVVGSTRLLPTSQKTREVGVLDVEIASGQDMSYSWKRVPNLWNSKLRKGEQEADEKIQAIVDAFLRPNQVVAKSGTKRVVRNPAVPVTVVAPRDGAQKPYYPSALCRSCHVNQYEDWAKSKHAAAIGVLARDGKMQPECLQCHSEQYRRLKTVTVSQNNVGGVGCASCHIDSLPHGLERKASATRAKVKPGLCLDCHTKERSPGYNEQAYFPKVSHMGAAPPQTASTLHSKAH